MLAGMMAISWAVACQRRCVTIVSRRLSLRWIKYYDAYRLIGLSAYRLIGLSAYRLIGLSAYRLIGLSAYRLIGLSVFFVSKPARLLSRSPAAFEISGICILCPRIAVSDHP
nr:hypothetical protein [Mixta theicola]